MIPTRLEEWTLPVIEDLLSKGNYESEHFDFKSDFPGQKKVEEKWGISKDCCAFANSGGGFLIFGVRNNLSLSANERLTGVEPGTDFFEHFGACPSRCTPSVDWDFRKPSLLLPSGRVIHVIHIPRSWQAPHWLEDLKNKESRHFSKRTNKGNEPMSYEEVKMAYLQFYEKRFKLQLLRAELESIKTSSQTFIIDGTQTAFNHDSGELGVAIIETVLADTYTILASHPAIFPILQRIRQLCRMINSKTVRLYQTIGDVSRKSVYSESSISQYNTCIRIWSEQIQRDCSEAIQIIGEIAAS